MNITKHAVPILEEIRESESNTPANISAFNNTEVVVEPANDSTVQTLSISGGSSPISTQSNGKTYGDFNGDGKDDLAIAVPFEDLGSVQDAGAVEVIYGSSPGISATLSKSDQFWTQDTVDIADIAQEFDGLGHALG